MPAEKELFYVEPVHGAVTINLLYAGIGQLHFLSENVQ